MSSVFSFLVLTSFYLFIIGAEVIIVSDLSPPPPHTHTHRLLLTSDRPVAETSN